MAKKEIEVKVKVDSKQAVNGVDELGKSLDNTAKSTENLSEQSGDLSSNMSGLGGAAGAAVGKVKAFGASLLRLALNPIGAVISAIALAVLAVKAAFERSEAGQNKYNKLMAVLGSIADNLLDKLADLGDAIISAFEKPQEALKSLSDAIKKNVTNRIEGLVELIPQLGKAISQLFSGDFAEAGKTAFDAITKVTTGVENMSEKIKQASTDMSAFIEEAKREAEIAANIADRRAVADKIERGLKIERAKADRDIIELRDIAARRDKFNSEERKAALEEALKINESIINKELSAARIRANAITLENKLSKSNKEALDAEAEAKAKVINLETQKLNLQKRLGAELSAINLQQAAEEKKNEEEAEKRAEKELEFKRKSGLKAIELEQELKMMRAEAALADPDASPEEIRAAFEAKTAVTNEIFEAELLANEEKFQNGLILEAERNAQKELIEQKHQDEIDKINQQGVKNLEVTEKAKDDVRNSSLNSALKGINALASMNEDSKALQATALVAGNIAAIGQTIQSTTIANAKAVAAFPITGGQPFVGINTASAAAGIAASVLATKKGLAELNKGGSTGVSSGGGGVSLPSGGGGSASAPSINTETLFSTQDLQGAESEEVGEGAGLNQIRATVLESDITTVQNNVAGFEEASEIG